MPASRLRLYRRSGCHLCDAVEVALAPVLRRLGLALEQIDIDGDDDLLKRYTFEIPVLELDGEEIARAPMPARAMADALEEAVRRKAV
jgi:hypothetical protein